jgi:hypothetical protein
MNATAGACSFVKGCGGVADSAAAGGGETGGLKLLPWSVPLRVQTGLVLAELGDEMCWIHWFGGRS